MAKPTTAGMPLPPNEIDSMHHASVPVALMVRVRANPQYGPYVVHAPVDGAPSIVKDTVPLLTEKLSALPALPALPSVHVQIVRLAQPGGDSGGNAGESGGGGNGCAGGGGGSGG